MKKTIKGLVFLLAFFFGKQVIIAQDLHTRNNGTSPTSVVIIRSDNASGDQDQNQTSDLDFQIWDSNTRLNIPQGRIGMVGEQISSQAKEASGRMAFYTTNEAYPSPTLIERMRIDQKGNIGIGTTSPNSKLQVQGTSGEQYQGQIHITGNGETGPGDAYISFAEGSEVNSKWSAGVKDNDNAFSISYGLTMDANPRFVITEVTGNVGIGTTTPDSKLTVAGKVHAQEVKVTINAGADFVFNDGYNLPKLKDVEQFIKENKHLPEIASEKEMQDNGLLLAEMNIKLLQKVEELTLYAIQQDKLLKSQDFKIKKLEQGNKQLNALNKKLLELQSRLENLESKS